MLRVDEESKGIYMNDFGSIVILVTKSNLIRVVDFLGRSLVFTIREFREGQKTSKIIRNNLNQLILQLFIVQFLKTPNHFV